MKVRPEYKSFGELFSESNVFVTPKYQRDYSWESEQIKQFTDDIRESLTDLESHHFFGGIVCAQEEGVGIRKVDNILIDGQQRLSTIVLFFSILHRELDRLDCRPEDGDFKSAIQEDISKYLFLEERVQREKYTHNRVTIGRSDNDFFQATLKGVKQKIERDSHTLIWSAKEQFESFIYDDLWFRKNTTECLEIADKIVKLFEESFLLIHIITTTIDEAYKLFMVLNDRGINLTEGELLKAHSIGNYKEDEYVVSMANDWDHILSEDSKSVSDYLRWVLIMLTGENVSSSQVLEKYRSSYLTDGLSSKEMAERVSFLREACEKLSLLANAEWPFESGQRTTSFHKAKLDWLVKKLKHTHAMPILLAAIDCGESEFQKIINETCKFFIRYKVVSNLHASIFSSLYPRISNDIFSKKDRYKIGDLQKEFSSAIESKDANNEAFMFGMKALVYKRKGDNRPIKYLMITIQENWRWVTSPVVKGVSERLKMEDRSVVFDFNNTSIEHLYPYSARERDLNEEMEKLKNRIGNLTILDPNKNSSNADKPFPEKKANFANSGIGVHDFIMKYDEWGEDEVAALESEYIDKAIRVFSF